MKKESGDWLVGGVERERPLVDTRRRVLDNGRVGAGTCLQEARGQGLRPRQGLRARAVRGEADARPPHRHDAPEGQGGEVQVHVRSEGLAARQVLVAHVRDGGGRPRVGPLADRRRVTLLAHAGRDDRLGLADRVHSRRDLVHTEHHILHRVCLHDTRLRHLGARRQDQPRPARAQRQLDRHGQGGPRGHGRVRLVRLAWRRRLRHPCHARHHSLVQHDLDVHVAARVQLEGDGRGSAQHHQLSGVRSRRHGAGERDTSGDIDQAAGPLRLLSLHSRRLQDGARGSAPPALRAVGAQGLREHRVPVAALLVLSRARRRLLQQRRAGRAHRRQARPGGHQRRRVDATRARVVLGARLQGRGRVPRAKVTGSCAARQGAAHVGPVALHYQQAARQRAHCARRTRPAQQATRYSAKTRPRRPRFLFHFKRLFYLSFFRIIHACVYVCVSVCVLAEDEYIQSKMFSNHSINLQTVADVAPIQIYPAKALAYIYSFLGKNERLGLTGRPVTEIGYLCTSKLYKMRDQILAFSASVGSFLDYTSFSLESFNCNCVFFL